MNLSFLGTKGTQALGKLTLSATRMSPELLLGAGIVGVVGTVVLASRATLKLNDDLEEMRDNLIKINDVRAMSSKLLNEGAIDVTSEHNYTDGQYKKDLFLVYVKGGLTVARRYMPAIVLGTLSIAAITGSHVILKSRNTALLAAYQAVQTSYDAYRTRVQNEFGEEKDQELLTGMKMEVIENKETGEKDKILWNENENNHKPDIEGMSPYARWFDEGTTEDWSRSPEYNKVFISSQQSMANMKLQARGYVFLNEVYEGLGLPKSKAGQVVGWVLNKDGDNFIDFGLYDLRNKHFANEVENAILLDFNVDGVIIDKFEAQLDPDHAIRRAIRKD